MAAHPEVGFQDLPDVHARGNAQGIQDDLHGRPVGEIRHVLLGQDAGDDALVAVTSRHLVPDRQLALHGDEDLDELYDPGGQLVTALQPALLLGEERLQDLDLALRLVDDLRELLLHVLAVAALDPQLQDVGMAQALENVSRELLAFLHRLVPTGVHEVRGDRLSLEEILDAFVPLVLKDANLVLQVLLHHEQLGVFDLLRPVVLLDALPGEDLDVDHDALRCPEGRRGTHPARPRPSRRRSPGAASPRG